MELIVKASPKEIAALVVALQERQCEPRLWAQDLQSEKCGGLRVPGKSDGFCSLPE